jgi:pSer/pThr/pTyr-binding forkhead associated (FHA) protein
VFEYEGRISTLANSGKIGRNITNDVIFIEDSISREHARIFKKEG